MNYDIDLVAVSRGFDTHTFWAQARAGRIPSNDDAPPTVVVTAQPTLRSGSDVFFALSEWRSHDLGNTWIGPTEKEEALGRRVEEGGVSVAICGMEPQWHAHTGVLLSTGHCVRYTDDSRPVPNGQIQVAYSVLDPNADDWSRWATMSMPDEDRFRRVAAGCSQRVDLNDGTILLPVHFRSTRHPAKHACNTVAVLRCSFDGKTLRYLDHGKELTLDEPRGFCEPSLAVHQGRYFLTLRNDVRGYVAVGEDGFDFSTPRPWCFDDGQELENYNTQQHWVTHGDDLFLVYTRRGLNNDHVFRHRAPLMIAQVDPDNLVVLRETERELVPNRGARLGNFSVCDVTDDETWVVVAEWMQPAGCEQYGSDNTIWAARIKWS